MRVISGKFKKHKLATLKTASSLRATSDKVKAAIFNIIGGSIEDANFLDLFAGSGAVGIEALSRGAKKVYFIEKSRANIKIIKENIKTLNIDKTCYKLFFSDAFKFLKHFEDNLKFDIIFLDPPYNSELVEKSMVLLSSFKGINENTLIVAETSVSVNLNVPENFKTIKERKYGDTILLFFKFSDTNNNELQ